MKTVTFQELLEIQIKIAAQITEWKFSEAMPAIKECLQLLEALPERTERWWHLWLDLQNNHCYALFAIGSPEELRANIVSSRPSFEKYASPPQKLVYLHTVQLDLLRRHRWFNVPEEAVVVAQTVVQLAENLQDTYQTAWGYNILGVTYLWRHEPVLSRIATLKAYELLKNTPDDHFGYSIAFANQIHSYRIERDVDNTEYWARTGLQHSLKNKIEGLEALSKVGLCWVMLKKNRLEESAVLGEEAFEILVKLQAPYIFVSLFPLLYLNLQKGELDKAADFAFLLLHHNMQELPADVTRLLRSILIARSKRDRLSLRSQLHSVVALADRLGSL